ncbi:MAG: desulfoferrodoxin [Rickettsiales bacterium]|nr:MAG: desulfoferrodoxin [Rickettsiales bacterium]
MKNLDIYKCSVCGNIVEVVTSSSNGVLSCCNKEMTPLKANSTDAANEKHVPVVEKSNDGYLVKVGSVEHPMTPEHYIMWIELVGENDKVIRKYLTPNDKPEVFFENINDEHFIVREYCNLHGLWESK